jgi:phosphatidate cytidylyltransferase
MMNAEGTRKTGAFNALPQRVLSSLAAFAVVVFLLWAGWGSMTVLLAFVVTLGLHEFRAMARKANLAIGGRSAYVFGILMLIASEPWMREGFWFVPAGVPWREIVIWAYLTWVMVVEVVRPSERPLERIMTSLLGMLYIPFLMSFALLIRYYPDNKIGFWYLIIAAVGAFASDTGAYFVGGWIGKRKLAPEISPSKTLEGALGGLIFSAMIVFLLQEAVRSFIPGVRVIEIWMFAILVASAAQLGDLAESVIKRSLGAKDSGTFLPGHGGMLDRLDSLLFALPVAYYFLSVAVFSQ